MFALCAENLRREINLNLSSLHWDDVIHIAGVRCGLP